MLECFIQSICFSPTFPALPALDMAGSGVIHTNRCLNALICKRLVENARRQAVLQKKLNQEEVVNKYVGRKDPKNHMPWVITRNDLQEFATIANIFDIQNGGTMSYQVFKKFFFPHLCHATQDEREGDDMDSQKGDEERKAKEQQSEEAEVAKLREKHQDQVKRKGNED